ncbi:MAG TPA: PilN domain-containing protein [Candidatus Woesebacteria bacterium]|nr:PilN domain-containing protein [Candidatus Woesebacteria bacterium]
MPAKKEISLLPKEENLNTFSARFLRWVTSVGRVVIIFVELIVIGAFLSRFWLDRKNSDLSETLRQQKAILGSTQEFEKDYVSLQERLKFIKNFYATEPKYIESLNSLIQSIPEGIYFENISFNSGEKSNPITGSVESYSYQEDAIIDFIVNLKLNPDISSVNVQKIEKKTKDSKFYLSLSLTFKKP